MVNNQTVFACDIGGSKLLCGLVDRAGSIIATRKAPLAPDLSTDSLEDMIEDFYRELSAEHPESDCTACGMTIPGLADPATGIWVYACFSGIADYPIAERMKARLGLDVHIANDVNACAWAEKIFGCCGDCDDFLWVTVSNGVGGGLVLNGKVYEGAFGGSGEFGHLVVEPEGLVCPCGHRGCMEAMAAGPAIAKRYELVTGNYLTADKISALARQGDATALEVLDKTGEYIGRGLAMAANLLNLRRFVLGGGVMQSFDLMENAINRTFRSEAFERPNRDAVILPTALKYEAGLLGAASLAFK